MVLWKFESIGFIPLTFALFPGITMPLVLIIATIKGDVSKYVPHISEAAAFPWQSGIFAIGFSMAGFVGNVFAFLHYQMVCQYNQGISRRNKAINILNKIALGFGMIAMTFMIVLAAYPMSSDPWGHASSTYIVFISFIIYMLVDSAGGFIAQSPNSSPRMKIIRLVLSVLAAISLIINAVTSHYGLNDWLAMPFIHWTGQKEPGDKGFTLLLVSAVWEWILAYTLIAFFVTFIKEFKKVKLQVNLQIPDTSETASTMDIMRETGKADVK